MVQKFKNIGMYGSFSKIIKKGFNKKYDDFTLKIEPLVSKEVVYKLMNKGDLKKITFRKLNLTPELIDQADINGVEANTGRIEFSIIANSRQKLPFMKKVLKALSSSEKELDSLLSINGFDYNSVKVNVNLNGKSRTLDLSTLDNVGAYFDITKEVDFSDDTNLPTLDSLKKVTVKYVNDLYKTIRKEGDDKEDKEE